MPNHPWCKKITGFNVFDAVTQESVRLTGTFLEIITLIALMLEAVTFTPAMLDAVMLIMVIFVGVISSCVKLATVSLIGEMV